jgi:response regulator of citrate/malate metabolism
MASNTAPLVPSDHAKYIRRKNSDGFRLKYALGHSERRQLIKDCGIHALVLFEYYLRLASTENALLTDEDAAEYFNWSKATAKRHRLTLTQKGWLAIERAKLNNGRKVHVYYLGKDEVAAAIGGGAAAAEIA